MRLPVHCGRKKKKVPAKFERLRLEAKEQLQQAACARPGLPDVREASAAAERENLRLEAKQQIQRLH